MAYTYDDFVSAAQKAGLLDKFSQYDLDLAQQYPEFGLSILSLKQDYLGAATDEQRTLANEAANELRKSYGNYTGGADGLKYYTGGVGTDSQSSFIYPTAPTYTNQYAEQQQALLDEILNKGEFSWSKENDPQWSSLKKTYLREGDRASANALAQVSAASGGRPSSYAVTAASQAGDYYATQLNDMIPTLYQQAYEQYLGEYETLLQRLSAVNGQEQLAYNKYLAELDQYNTDRSFSYGVQQDESETAYNRSIYEQELAAAQSESARSLARQQVDAILAAGGTPSDELVAASGYSSEYVQALALAYRQSQTAGSGTTGGGNTTGTEPTVNDIFQQLVDANVTTLNGAKVALGEMGYSGTTLTNYANYYMEQLEAGVLTPTPEDRTGKGYSTVRSGGASEWDMVKQSLKATLREGKSDAAMEYLRQVHSTANDEQKQELIEIMLSYGWTLEGVG